MVSMAKNLDGLPQGVSQAGLDFDYTVWTPGTEVLMTNVPWDAMYRDVVSFPHKDALYNDQAQLDAWLNTQPYHWVPVTKLTYAKPGMPVRLPVSFSTAWNYNYLRVKNPSMMGETGLPGSPRTFYYFINEVRYVNPGTTELDIQLDVWSTFIHQCVISNAYIERGHVGIANEAQFFDYGKEFLTQPEGLDLGSEYQITMSYSEVVGGPDSNVGDFIRNKQVVDIMVCSTTSITTNPGTVEAPSLKTAQGSTGENLPNGCEIVVMSMTNFANFARQLKDYPWIAQGIISITAIPPGTFSSGTIDVGLLGSDSAALKAKTIDHARVANKEWRVVPNFRNEFKLPNRYKHLKKFLTSPYALVEMTCYTGNPIILKPEFINDPHATAIQLTHVVPPQPRVSFIPYRYNAGQAGTVVREGDEVYSDYGAEWMDVSFGIFNLPQFSITNSGYLQYMAANRNSIAYGYESADWSQQRALTGNQLSFDQSSSAIELGKTMTGLGIGAANASTGLTAFTQMGQGAVSVGQGLAGGWMNGGMRGAALSAGGTAINTALSVNQTVQQNAINTGLMANQNNVQSQQMGYIRDSNKQFADWAARGDYANTIAGLNAKVQDAKMIQPTTAGQVGGDAFILATMGWSIHVKLKQIHPGAMRAIGDYWLRYGYAINRWSGGAPIGLHCMEKFTYWKLKETYLSVAWCPEYYRGVIRGIFEKGVTVWRHPDYLGRTDIADNKPLKGIWL